MPAQPGRPAELAVIRCRDLAAMVAFYRDIVGLELVEDEAPEAPESGVVMRAAEGFAPPERRVALVPAEDEEEPAGPSHRLTLTVADAAALARAESWLRANGLAPETDEQAAIGWKCLRVSDPEGNTLELAAPVRQRTVPGKAPAAD